MLEFVIRNGRRYAQFARLRQRTGLVHAFSTRPDDVSPRTTGGDTLRAERRGRMASDWGLDPTSLAFCQQIHGPQIATVADPPPPSGILAASDAAITNAPGVPLMTFSADCPLILLFDPGQRAVGLVHASWRCTVARNTARTVERMTSDFGTRPANLLAGIGPGAGPCCYEVKDDVRDAARVLREPDRFFPHRGGRMYFDLWSANRAQLIESGLREDNIEQADVCTMCRTDLFFSFRREGPACGHFALLAAVPQPELRGRGVRQGTSDACSS